jgi:hypothetical protein
MRRHEKEMADRLDAMSVEQARREIASGAFGDIGSPNHTFAASLLSARETSLREARGAEIVSLLRQQSSNTGTAVADTAGDPSVKVATWKEIEKEYGISKKTFGKKINFVKDAFKRQIISRDIEQAYSLAFNGFNKPAVILAGGIIEELLRLYIESKGITLHKNTLDFYIRTCEEKGILKKAIHKLADSFREFRNLVHLQREESPRHSISKSTAKSAVASVFTIINDFSTEPLKI